MKNLLRILIVLTITLVIAGALLVLSSSDTYSAIKFNNLLFLFNSHLWKVLAAIVALIIFSMLPYEHYKKFSKYMLLGVIILLIFTRAFGEEINGAHRWINVGLFKFQPSELVKIILPIHLALLLEKKGELIKDFNKGLVYPMFWIFFVSALILVQPNISTSIIIILTSFTLLFICGASPKHLVATIATTAIVAVPIMLMFAHVRDRIFDFYNHFFSGSEMNIQVKQAKIALGSGGIFGIGLGQSRQSDLFLPESYGDFIFSILGEELGFIGAIITLLIYLGIFISGVIIAYKAKDKFGQLVAFALSFNILIAAFINAAVVMGKLPTTGITLPFISFGGTSIIIFCISVGIIINIGLQSYKAREIRLVQE